MQALQVTLQRAVVFGVGGGEIVAAAAVTDGDEEQRVGLLRMQRRDDGLASRQRDGCRRQSGAAYSVNLVVRTSSMTIEGTPSGWEDRATASGYPLSREHCGSCGAPVRSVMSAVPQIVAVKAGSLDDPAPFAPAMHIWTQSKLPWVEIPAGVPSFPQDAPR